MSIKKSLRLLLILMASLPMIFLTVLAYIVSHGKYLDLAKESAENLAYNYANALETQLNVQIAALEGLSQ